MGVHKLAVIVVSTRPGRKGILIGRWFHQFAIDDAGFGVEFIDLAEINLPIFDEPHHPRMRNYEHDHTKEWSQLIQGVDAVVFVAPEYNHFAPPSLINALNYLSHEWAYKPVGFVSYGGVSGGLRGVQSIKPMLTGLKMMPIPEAVTIPMFTNHIDGDGVFNAAEHHEHAATVMLNELKRWTEALATLRA